MDIVEARISRDHVLVETIDPIFALRADGSTLFIYNGFYEYDYDLSLYQVEIRIRPTNAPADGPGGQG